jgi:hypothetical protein
MEFRSLGRSGLKVPVLSFGAGTSAGSNEFLRAWGATSDGAEATRLVDICPEAGVNLSIPPTFIQPDFGSNSGQGDCRAAQRCFAFNQDHFPFRKWAERCRFIGPSPDPGLRSQFAAAGHRFH